MHSDVRVRDGALYNRRGVRLHCRSWKSAAPPPSRTALILHGLGEHIGCYHELACFLTGHSYQVFGLDLYGFGASGGKRGHVRRIDDYLDDLHLLFHVVRSEGTVFAASHEFPGTSAPPGQVRERLLYGHSMGGLLALAYLERFPEDCTHAVVSSPSLDPAFGVPVLLRLLGKLLGIVGPSLAFSNRISPEELTADEPAREGYREDELRHSLITPRLFNQLVKLGERVRSGRHLLNPELALLFLLGGEDTVIRREDCRAFLRDLRVRSSRLRVLPGMRHDLLAGEDSARTFRELASWIAAEAAGSQHGTAVPG